MLKRLSGTEMREDKQLVTKWSKLFHARGPATVKARSPGEERRCDVMTVCVCACRYDGNALLSCIEVYNQQTESWELLDKGMTTQRCDAGLTVVHLR